jgi:hypothetical protein
MQVKSLQSTKIGRIASQYICTQCRFLSATSRQTKWRSGATAPQKLGNKVWSRGAKSKSTLKINAIPQGCLPAKAIEPIDANDGPVYPTVVQQARNNMQKFSHCVVLTRVGNFYEVCTLFGFGCVAISLIEIYIKLYFEHAEEYGPLLNLKVAQKPTRAGPVPMVCKP